METYKYKIGQYEYDVLYFVDAEDWVSVKLPDGEIRKASLGMGNKLTPEFLILDMYGNYMTRLYHFDKESILFAKQISEKFGEDGLKELEILSPAKHTLLACASDEDLFKFMQLTNPQLVVTSFQQLQNGVEVQGKELILNANSKDKLVSWSDRDERAEIMRLSRNP